MVHTLPDYTSKWRSDTPTVNLNVSESARRINPVSSPDGRGRMRWFDDMQGAIGNWYYQTTSGGANSLTVDYPYTGDQAFRVETSATAGSVSSMFKVLDPGYNPRIGVECLVAVMQNDGIFTLQLSCGGNGYYAVGGLKIDIKNDIVYLNPDVTLSWHKLADHEFSVNNRAYMSLKLVGDFSTGKWVRAIVNGVEYDISAYTWTKAAGPQPYRSVVTLKGGNIDAEVCKYNIGAVFLTDQEP